jgi:hypothetical protein
MRPIGRIILLAAVLALCLPARTWAADTSGVYTKKGVGTLVTGKTTDKVGFHGKTPVVQRAGAAQAAITDSTTGTSGATAAAGTGVYTLAIPIKLAAITGAGDVLTTYTPAHKFKVLRTAFAVTSPATTADKAATLNVEIGTTNVTGGEIALTSANSTPLGAVVAGASVTAANTGTSADTISIEAASVAAFAEGEGVLLLMIQNMDTADAHASEIARINELRASLVEKGIIKGAP